VQDIGGGIRTALAQVVAEELGLRPRRDRRSATRVPRRPRVRRQRDDRLDHPPARNAAHKVKQQLLEQVAQAFASGMDRP
jgi:xanthine dehydrogenase YagR molybdenum-binding subunit